MSIFVIQKPRHKHTKSDTFLSKPQTDLLQNPAEIFIHFFFKPTPFPLFDQTPRIQSTKTCFSLNLGI
ncbi:hypothetical protein L6452_16796 [Arctium lappa]|uniref:Uncharacterized protein n=1 Tax=Arctium lappa TaxID=4217 RepID=A0ACB9C1S5_ARCLA|nr:hypothetical protein L6452_16796 [Arctium lappa]